MHSSWLKLVALGILFHLAIVGEVVAVTPLTEIGYSPDVTMELDASTINDEDIAIDDLGGSVTLVDLGALPAEAELTACHEFGNGDYLVAFATTVVLGGLTAQPQDLVRIDTSQVASLELDGSAIGIPDDARIDALTMDGNNYLISFDVTVDLDGAFVDDEDVVRYDGTFVVFFDGSVEGVDASLDLDGVHLLSNGNLLLSFDTSASIGGVAASDEDVLEFAAGPVWELAYDGSALHAGWAGGSIDGLFARELTYTLVVSKSGGGDGTVTDDLAGIDCGGDCDGVYAAGTDVTLSAAADGDFVFMGWSGGGCTGTSTCLVTMDSNQNVDARFVSGPIFMDGFETGDTSAWSQVVSK